MDLKHTQFAVQDGIATITLHRPQAMNAFTTRMLEEMLWAIERCDRDDAVRVVIVTGSGDKAFCAGADISAGESAFVSDGERKAPSIADHRDGGGMLTLAIHRCRKPVIGAINGHAVGVGITMTLPMDVRVVAEDAKIGFVFTRRGIVPEACSSWFLPRIVGISKATELCYTGRVFRAADERDSGLFNYVVPRDQVLAKATEIAREIADNTSAVSVALAKALLWHGLGEDDPQSAHLIDSKCIYWTSAREDAAEGVTSFFEKRAPKFTMSATSDMPDFYPWWKEPKI
jgi:enoyl-CoA hydratase/carnithine racemase